jgi:hypothetical protein
MMAVIRNECEVVMMLICSFVWFRFSSGSVVSFCGNDAVVVRCQCDTYFTPS